MYTSEMLTKHIHTMLSLLTATYTYIYTYICIYIYIYIHIFSLFDMFTYSQRRLGRPPPNPPVSRIRLSAGGGPSAEKSAHAPFENSQMEHRMLVCLSWMHLSLERKDDHTWFVCRIFAASKMRQDELAI